MLPPLLMLSREQLPLHFHLGTKASEWLAAKPHSLSFQTSINIVQRGNAFDVVQTNSTFFLCSALVRSDEHCTDLLPFPKC
ncbi:hypothetical protein Mapa_010481 [Marchantia paleacea]|nr:hypothetical protein Mapa_010481 [Marchantia paleacea]